jgi:TPP-dependent pyruvate/acetoin dehydrogenase alpha subunit
MEALSITPNLELPAADLERFYGDMVRIRRFEERVTELFKAGVVKGTAHSYAGEEAIAVGTCAHLRDDDYIASYHRGHGHCIAKGARPDRMMAELMGRSTGYCGGLGGSMHVADLERNILGANGIVGAAMPLSVGAALAVQLRGGDRGVLRRWRQQPGHLSRIPEPRRGLEAAGAVHLREQPLCAQHLVPADDLRRFGRPARAGLRHPRPHG